MIYNYPSTQETFVSDYIQVASMGTLTKLELKVVSSLVRIYLEVQDWEYVFNATSYNRVYEESGLTKKTNMYKVVTGLRKKNVIKDIEGVSEISRILIPQDDTTFGIKFILK